MATLSDFNGQASFTIGGNSFNNRESSGTPIYERTGGDGSSSSSASGGFIDQTIIQGSTTGQLADFDPTTQVVMVQSAISQQYSGGSPLTEIEANDVYVKLQGTATQSTSGSWQAQFKISPTGAWQSTESNRNENYTFYITRFYRG